MILSQKDPKALCMFGLQLLQDNDGNMELTNHLYLQESGYWEQFTKRSVIPNSNQSELYFEEPNIAANMDFLLVCTYEENGENPELVIYKKR